MFKVEIELNRQKIINEGIYDYNKMVSAIDGAFRAYGISNVSTSDNVLIYSANGIKDKFANYWAAMLRFKNQDWFLSNVKKWLWYNESSRDKQEHYVDNLLNEYLEGIKDEYKTLYSYN